EASTLFEDLDLLRMEELAARGESRGGGATVVAALERGRERVNELRAEKARLDADLEHLRRWLFVLGTALAAALAGLLLLAVR
ncbi:MAG: hypothetical protein V1918_03600, partial [Planctomycetota bacterium]